jgi:MOSC domain-containing protein YiiM
MGNDVHSTDITTGKGVGHKVSGRREFMILSLNVSQQKGVCKKPVEAAEFQENHGMVGDAHAGPWHRQVSLLADEDVETMRNKGIEIGCGDFGENITTRGIELASLPIGTKLYAGDVVLEVTQIGKECHHGCAIYEAVGDCVMPRQGIFARVVRGGVISGESPGHYDI